MAQITSKLAVSHANGVLQSTKTNSEGRALVQKYTDFNFKGTFLTADRFQKFCI